MSSVRRLVVALALVLAAGAVTPARAADAGAAPDDAAAGRALDYAAWLAARGELYRAAGELLRVQYLAPGGEAARRAQLELGRVYQRAGQAAKAAAAYRDFLGAAPRAHAAALFDLALVEVQLSDPTAAREHGAAALAALGEAQPPATGPILRAGRLRLAYVEGLAAASDGQWDAARTAARATAALCSPGVSEPECLVAARSLALLDEGPPARRFPALAAGLSLLVPGAGQLYAAHRIDALTYFGLTALAGFLAWDAHDGGRALDDQRPGFYVLSGIAAAFWAANVVSAWNSATRINVVARGKFRSALLAPPFPAPGSLP